LKHAALIGQAINPKLITWVRAHNRQIQIARQDSRAACVINVRAKFARASNRVAEPLTRSSRGHRLGRSLPLVGIDRPKSKSSFVETA
jgi:hypothetical protein